MYRWNKNKIMCIGLAAATLFIALLLSSKLMAFQQDNNVVAYGERLVHNMDCNVCHTPKVFTPEGPRLDSSRLLSGHPADEQVPSVPEGLIGPSGWGGLFNNSLTMWVGPWGISYGSNLTPDNKTGIGLWTEEIFFESMRNGKNVGRARPFLPPMPTYSRLTDEELHAIYAYLRSLKPIVNKVPEASPAAMPGQRADKK